MSTATHDLIPDEDRILQACFRWAHADAAPYRERALPAGDIATLAAQYADVRYPPNALYDGPENGALRDCYAAIFRVTATPPGQWQSLDGERPC